MDTRVRVAVAIVAVAAVALAACGVEAQDEAQPLDPDSVPFDLLEPEAPSVTVPEEGNQFVVFLVDEDRLVAVTRAVKAPLTVARALRALVRGPTNVEATSGITSAIPPGAQVRRVVVRGDRATVDLGGAFSEMVRGEALALAQIVYTATGLGDQGVTELKFRVDRERVVVPRGDGTLTNAPVGRNDYPGPGP